MSVGIGVCGWGVGIGVWAGCRDWMYGMGLGIGVWAACMDWV